MKTIYLRNTNGEVVAEIGSPFRNTSLFEYLEETLTENGQLYISLEETKSE